MSASDDHSDLPAPPPPPNPSSARPRAAFRTHSSVTPGDCFCYDENKVGSRGPRAGDLRLGCGCSVHFHCLERYLLNHVLERTVLSARQGIKCPRNNPHLGRDSCGVGDAYTLGPEDLDALVDYGGVHSGDISPRSPSAVRLTHELVQLIRNPASSEVSCSDPGPPLAVLTAAVVDALSLKCPDPECANLLPGEIATEDCCAAKCEKCDCCFCWYCFQIADPPDHETRHNHVMRCQHNPNPDGDLYLRPAKRIEPIHKQRRIEAIRRVLQLRVLAESDEDWLQSDQALEAVAAAAPYLSIHKIDPSEIFASGVTECERGEVDRLFIPEEDFPEVQVEEANRALFDACRENDEDSVTALLENGDFDDINAIGGIASVLCAAAAAADAEDAEDGDDDDPLAEGDDRQDYMNALHVAARNGYDVVVNLLLENGAENDCRTGQGRSALHLACINTHASTVRLLLEVYNFDVDATDDSGDTPLMAVIDDSWMQNALSSEAEILQRHERVAEVVRHLVGANSQVNHPNLANGRTPLMRASEAGNVNAVRILLDAGANVTVGGVSALSLAREALQMSTEGNERLCETVALLESAH